MSGDTSVLKADEENTHHATDQHFDIPHADDDEDPPVMPESETGMISKIETAEGKTIDRLYEDCNALDNDLRSFEPKHKQYVSKLEEVESLKAKYRAEFDKYMKKLVQLQNDIKELQTVYSKKDDRSKVIPSKVTTFKNSQSSTALEEKKSSLLTAPSRPIKTVNSSPSLENIANTLSPVERLERMSEQVQTNVLYLSRVADTLPRQDRYLKVILGGVDVSILNKANKWTYKQEYEKFKFIVTCIALVSSVVIWSLTSHYRAFDALFHFLLVWYYCTLTIRESILVVNGSNINRWWRTHHFLATVSTAILLTWPDSKSYHTFRTQFFVFSFYLSFVQGLQFYYQRGCLYRLRALGETNDMEITIEGFHRWIFRGLTFLVPFLLLGYLFQLYNAYTLFLLARTPTTHEWQVMVLSIMFFVFFLGNMITTLSVLREKLREKPPPMLLKEKYQSIKSFLSTNYHRRTGSMNMNNGRVEKARFNQNILKRITSKED